MNFSSLCFVLVGEALGLFNAIDGVGLRDRPGVRRLWVHARRRSKIYFFVDGTVYNNAYFLGNGYSKNHKEGPYIYQTSAQQTFTPFFSTKQDFLFTAPA